MRKPAFTLLEVLVTAVIFVVVAGLATASFAATARYQSANKQNQNTSAQLQDVLKSLSGAVERSVTTDPAHQPVVIESTQDVNQGNKNQILVLDSRKAQLDSSLSTATLDDQWEVYCVESANGLQRIVRYTAPANATLNYNPNAPQPKDCTKQAMNTLLTGQTVTGPLYLTEPNLNVNALHFVPVYYSPQPTGSLTPPAVRIEIAAQYNPAADTSVESRASDIFNNENQLVVRTVANRIDPAFLMRNP